MSKENECKGIVTLPEDLPQLPDLKGKVGGATVKASQEESSVAEMHKTVKKNEGNRQIEQKADKVQKQDSTQTAQASIKTTNEGGVLRTVATTVVTTSSSFEEEEFFEEKVTSGPITTSTTKSIAEK